MARKSNRAFTLVELIIVIAVIGVLAAILIPVFSNVVKKANIADKTSLARNLNTQLAAENDGTARVLTMGEAMAIAHKTGYTDDQLFNTETAGTIVFNTATGNFAVADKVENGTATLAYADQGMKTAPAASLIAPVEVTEVPAVSEQVFGMYLVDTAETPVSYTIDTRVSVDVGEVTVSTINFATDAAGDFTFRTVGGRLNIDAANANVNHYGYSDEVHITAVASQSYHEFGTVGFIEIAAGHLVIEAGAHVLQGISALTLDGVSITLFAEAALVGEQSQLQSIITDSTNSNNVDYVATMPESLGFAGGSGTKNDPYIIATANQFMNLGKEWYAWTWESYLPTYEQWLNENAYVYAKVMDGVSKIDFSSVTAISFCGEFDGNGATFTNVNAGMFSKAGSKAAPATVIKNFTFNANSVGASGHRGALVKGYCYGDVTFENVTAHGYVECYVAASFIAYGNAAQGAWHCTFKNCVSDMTIVSTGENAGGFIAHQFCGSGSVLTFENSKFIGKMATTGTMKAKYFTAMDYASAQIVVKTDEALPISGGYGTVGEHTLKTETSALYNADAMTSKVEKFNLSAPAKYDIFTAATVTGAVRATAVLSIGPNDTNETGNFLSGYMVEECTLDNGTFKTNKIKYFDLTVNGNATPKTGVSEDGKTFNIVSEGYGHTIGSANVAFKLYDANNNIVAVYTYAFVNGTDF